MHHPRFKNVSITPARPNLVKRNPTHSVSCGTTTSPPPPSGGVGENTKPESSLETSIPEEEDTPAESSASPESQSKSQAGSPAQDLSFSQSAPSDLHEDNQAVSSTMQSSTLLGQDQPSSTLLGQGQPSSTVQEENQTSQLMGKSQSSMLDDVQPMSSSLLEKHESVPTSSHDEVSLINFDPPPSTSSMEYSGYDYPQYGAGSGFYSSQSYQHTPTSTNYSDNSYPYDMYSSSTSNVNPFSAAAAGSFPTVPNPNYQPQSSAFHRPDTSYPPLPPPPSYPPQYPSDFYPPPP